MRYGVISDTHGLLRPEMPALLEGVDHIFHIGDVGEAGIIAELARIAPVTAVRGNVDRGGEVGRLPLTEAVESPAGLLYLIHILDDLDLDPAAAGIRAVLHGHTHRPDIRWGPDGVLYLNPGSCGPRRFDLPVTMAYLDVVEGELRPMLIPVPIPTQHG